MGHPGYITLLKCALKNVFFAVCRGHNVSPTDAKIFYDKRSVIHKYRDPTKRNGKGKYAAVHSHFGLTVAQQDKTDKVFEKVLIIPDGTIPDGWRALSAAELDSDDPDAIKLKREVRRFPFPYERKGSEILNDPTLGPAVRRCLAKMSSQARNVDPLRWDEMMRATEDVILADGRVLSLRLIPDSPIADGTISIATLEPFKAQAKRKTRATPPYATRSLVELTRSFPPHTCVSAGRPANQHKRAL